MKEYKIGNLLACYSVQFIEGHYKVYDVNGGEVVGVENEGRILKMKLPFGEVVTATYFQDQGVWICSISNSSVKCYVFVPYDEIEKVSSFFKWYLNNLRDKYINSILVCSEKLKWLCRGEIDKEGVEIMARCASDLWELVDRLEPKYEPTPPKPSGQGCPLRRRTK